MTELERNKMALDYLCGCAERACSAKTDIERFEEENRAYMYLAVSGFPKYQMDSFSANFRRIVEELK